MSMVFQYTPCLAEVKRLSLDFLWVYMYWEKTGHFINRPVKLGWSLGREETDEEVNKILHTPFSTAKLEDTIQHVDTCSKICASVHGSHRSMSKRFQV